MGPSPKKSKSRKSVPSPPNEARQQHGNPISLPIAIIVCAVACGVMLGFAHQSQGIDLADTILARIRGVPPTPSLIKAGRSSNNPLRSTSGATQALVSTIKVNVHRNGESSAVGSVTLRPKSVRSLGDLSRTTGALIQGCEEKGACRAFDEHGREVEYLGGLKDKQNLWLVPKGRHFVWPAFHVGYKTELPRVAGANNKPITLTTLSDSPRVFMVENFFSEQDADELVETALSITEEGFALKRSTTGAKGAAVSLQRTSENAFDTSSPVAMKLKRRVFELLGIRPYVETWADGLQVLRYNKTRAYIPHLDYLENAANHNFDSAGAGTNRFATVLLYLTDVEAGGETVFVHGKPLAPTQWLDDKQGVQEARARGLTKDLEEGSWEEEMVGQCIGRLAAKPAKGKAVLFYSQLPNGQEDNKSLHGGCPVLEGVKWAANLWVWNGPRYGYAPLSGGDTAAADPPIHAEFSSTIPCDLWWENQWWGQMGEEGDQPHRVNTYPGHKWHVRERGLDTILHTWVMQEAGSYEEDGGTLSFVYEG